MIFIKKIWRIIKSKPIALVLFLCVIISLNVLNRHRWRENNWKSVVHSDGCGYYGYLPAIFIYHDLQYRFYLDLKDKYGFGDLSENFLNVHDGKYFNRYFCGTAIAQMPFFLLAWLASVLFGFDADGHSFLFNCSVNLAALFYAMMGCHFLSRYLLQFFRPRIVAAATGAIFLGTNLFNYTVYESSYSHAYSFGFICLFIFLADRCIRFQTRKSLVYLSLCLGLIVLIRPSNALVVLSIPFIAGSWKKFIEWLQFVFLPKNLLPAIFIGMASIGIQSALYWFQCGAFWVDGYPHERFNFLEPNILNALFSYKAGLFMWSPAALISLPGLYYLSKKSRYLFASFCIFMLINVWVISSWWAWHYAGTFGMRPMVDYMGFFIILLSGAMSVFRSKLLRIFYFVFVVAATLIGNVFNFQIARDILPHDLMTKEKYWYIFMKTNQKFAFDLDPPYQIQAPKNIRNIQILHYDFLPHSSEDTLPNTYPDFNAAKSLNYFGYGEIDLLHLPLPKHEIDDRFYVDLKVKTNYTSVNTSGSIIVIFMEKGTVKVREEMPVICPQFEPGQWNPIRLSFRTREQLKDVDEVVIRVHNGNRHKVLLQEMELTLASFASE